jgi:hypothetical protein
MIVIHNDAHSGLSSTVNMLRLRRRLIVIFGIHEDSELMTLCREWAVTTEISSAKWLKVQSIVLHFWWNEEICSLLDQMHWEARDYKGRYFKISCGYSVIPCYKIVFNLWGFFCPRAQCLVGSGVVTDRSAVRCCKRDLPSPVALRTVGSRNYRRVVFFINFLLFPFSVLLCPI